MIKAVLFDLDDTLLDLNLTAFLVRYYQGLAERIAHASDRPSLLVSPALALSLARMEDERRTDSLLNRDFLRNTFFSLTGIPLGDPAFVHLWEEYDLTVAPTLGGGPVMARPMPGGRAAIEAVRSMGLTCALATNPNFSLEADLVRMGWAQVEPEDFVAISSWETATRVKPNALYYEEFCAQLGFAPQECLMVGNNARLDFPHPPCGIRTAYVGHARPQRAVWWGDLQRFADDLQHVLATAERA